MSLPAALERSATNAIVPGTDTRRRQRERQLGH